MKRRLFPYLLFLFLLVSLQKADVQPDYRLTRTGAPNYWNNMASRDVTQGGAIAIPGNYYSGDAEIPASSNDDILLLSIKTNYVC